MNSCIQYLVDIVGKLTALHEKEMREAGISAKPLIALIGQYYQLDVNFSHENYKNIPIATFLPLLRQLINELSAANILTHDFFKDAYFNRVELVKILAFSGVSLTRFTLNLGWSNQLTDVPVYSSEDLDYVISKNMTNFWVDDKIKLTISQLTYCMSHAQNKQDLLLNYYVDHHRDAGLQEVFNEIFPFKNRTFDFYKNLSARFKSEANDRQYLEASIPADKPIFSLSNDELIKFSKWLSLEPVLKESEAVLQEKLLSVIKRPISASFLKKLIEFYDGTKSWKWFNWLDDEFIKQLRQMTQSVSHAKGALSTNMHDALSILVLERRWALEKTPDQDYTHAPHSAVNQVFMALIWMLERAGYHAERIRPAAFNEMGAEMILFGELNYNDIFMVAEKENFCSFTTQDIITTLKMKGDLLHPLTYQPFSEETIEEVLYRRPVVREEMRAYIDRWLQSCPDAVLSISSEVIEALDKLAQDLWDNSEEAENVFNERLANVQLTKFHLFMKDRLKDVCILDQCAFPLASRGNAVTNYKGLFAKTTYDGCVGQLGLAVRQYTEQLKTTRENKKAGGLKEVPFERYMRMNGCSHSMLHFQMPKKLESTGTKLAKRLSASLK